ncbi:gamma-interferon-inducible-lysosomal thiol reductase-like isoform X2 [Hippocampus comes]|uniref:gamma-interferon-inducible-lysosomal thiol reductase-like isoform X2 n=1 Tax=Hippocampus comes TaxID=109280 RepID=UPI00094EC174|nr:PREDICTED: gamma-interferon-inducible-lysosomal thiol reductase-like isoform X2 [Hippocampus comes]
MKVDLPFTLTLIVHFSSLSSSCPYTLAQCCSSLNSAVQCGAGEPVHLDVYYESLCPDCILYLTQVLYPTWVLLQDILCVRLVPFGNAQEIPSEGKYIFKCQHGEQECLGNMIQTCLLNMTDNAFLIIFCMEASTDVIAAAKSCVHLYSPKLSWERLMSCVDGDVGNQLMHQNALRTNALDPPHQFVPWLTINGAHTDDLQKKATTSLFPLICSMYKGIKPVVCGNVGQKHRRI